LGIREFFSSEVFLELPQLQEQPSGVSSLLGMYDSMAEPAQQELASSKVARTKRTRSLKTAR